ncbi:hypothetical protein GCM10029992_18740 [Glycomyces albus]
MIVDAHQEVRAFISVVGRFGGLSAPSWAEAGAASAAAKAPMAAEARAIRLSGGMNPAYPVPTTPIPGRKGKGGIPLWEIRYAAAPSCTGAPVQEKGEPLTLP